jgi:hypothetical protein
MKLVASTVLADMSDDFQRTIRHFIPEDSPPLNGFYLVVNKSEMKY